MLQTNLCVLHKNNFTSLVDIRCPGGLVLYFPSYLYYYLCGYIPSYLCGYIPGLLPGFIHLQNILAALEVEVNICIDPLLLGSQILQDVLHF